MPKRKQTKAGGTRSGAGRKPSYGEPTASLTIRVPVSLRKWLDARDESISKTIFNACKHAGYEQSINP